MYTYVLHFVYIFLFVVSSPALVAESIDVPLSLFAKGVHYALDDLSHAGYDVLSIDWTIKPQVARAAVGSMQTFSIL